MRLALFLLVFAPGVRGTPEFDSALLLLNEKRYPEARPLLERVVAADPKHAAAWHRLGLAWRARHDTPAYEQAVRCLRAAAELDPRNPQYLADYGGTAMELANRTRSFAAAKAGREAMERAVALEPSNLDAREGLFQFYLRAPFLVGGSKAKAEAQLEEIGRFDRSRALVLSVLVKVEAKDYAAAFALLETELRQHPDHYAALYQYGRTAAASGMNLARGLECLQRALTLPRPGPASPTRSNVWYRIGVVHQKLGDGEAAKHAYRSALEADASNQQAATALAKLKPGE